MSQDINVRNTIRIRTILIIILAYLAMTVVLFGVFLVIAVITWTITASILRREEARLAGDAQHFRKSFPFNAYGAEYGDFEHVWFHDADLSRQVVSCVDTALSKTFPGGRLTPVSLVDTDPDLTGHETRGFHLARITTTARATDVSLILRTEQHGRMQSVRWWLLLGGFIDRNKRTTFLAWSPVTFWFWIIPYLRGHYNIVDKVRTVYGAAYNDMDVLTLIRGGHKVVFDTLVAVLDENGIDTSELQMQRAQVMNITVSGGKVNMGNVVQGAMNKVAARMGSKAA